MHTYYTNPNDDDFCQILREERNKGETHQQRTIFLFIFSNGGYLDHGGLQSTELAQKSHYGLL